MELCTMITKTLCHLLLVCCMMGPMVTAGRCFTMAPNQDLFLVAGSDLHLNCSLKVLSNGSDCIEDFNLNKTWMSMGSQELPTELFDYHEAEKTLTLTMLNVSLKDSGYYHCQYADNGSQAFRNVNIGELPGPPENITCISNNFEDLICSFFLSKQSVNLPMSWTMEYQNKRDDTARAKVNCSRNTDQMSIKLECPASVFTHFAAYLIFIEGVNKDYNVKVNKTSQVKLNDSIVKSKTVRDLNVGRTNTSSMVNLSWNGPEGMTYSRELLFPFDYRLTVISQWDNKTKMIHNTMAAKTEYSLTDLIPFTNYTVIVQAKPTAAIGDIYWSSDSSVYFVTSYAIPEHSVSVTAGSYMVLACGEDMMCPIIYWKNPGRQFWNGPLTGYQILIEEFEQELIITTSLGHVVKREVGNEPEYRTKRLIPPVIENVTGTTVSQDLTSKLNMSKDYRVKIRLMNSEGLSKNTSELVIPNWDKGQKLSPTVVVVEMVDSSVYISWNIDPLYCSEVTSVTYYWCLLDTEKPFNSTIVSCKDNFDWYTISIFDGCGNETGHTIVKQLIQPNVKYAVSVETRGVSGGLKWEKFRFNKQDVPEKPLYSVDSERTSLTVNILYADYYISEGGRPENYSVVYSKCVDDLDCSMSSTTKTFTANFTKPGYIIRNLTPGSWYSVYVTAENRFGRSKGDEKKIKTIADDQSSSAAVIVGVVCGSIFLFVLFVVGIYCVKKKHKKMTKDLKVKMPDMDETAMIDGSYNRIDPDYIGTKNKLSDDHDSGKGSDSPSSSLGQINPALQTDATVSEVNEIVDGGQLKESVSAVTDNNSIGSFPFLCNQRSSPALTGYRKHVSKGLSEENNEKSDEDTDEEDESAGDFMNTKVIQKVLLVPKQTDDLKPPEEDYCLAAVNDGSSKDSVSTAERLQSHRKSTNKPVQITESSQSPNKTLNNHQNDCNPQDFIENNKVMCAKSQGGSELDYGLDNDKETDDNMKVLPAVDVPVNADHGGKNDEDVCDDTSDIHLNDLEKDSELNAPEFESVCKLSEPSLDSPYKNPEDVSLWDSSTISDDSDDENMDSNEVSECCPDKEFEISKKQNVRKDAEHSNATVEECSDKNEQNKADVNDDADAGKGINVVENVDTKDNCQSNAMFKAKENVNMSGHSHTDIESDESKDTSSPPYIKAGSDPNEFVKSVKKSNGIIKEPVVMSPQAGINEENVKLQNW